MLAIAYRSRNVPQALMNLILNNGIARHKQVETTMIYRRVLNRTKRLAEWSGSLHVRDTKG